MSTERISVIAAHPTPEMYAPGLEIDCCCARCGSSIYSEPCGECEDGFDGHPEENVTCQYCDGTGVWHQCISSAEWCQANPLPGREDVERGAIEWFTLECRESP